MKIIDGVINPEIGDSINEFADWFFRQDRSPLKLNGVPDENERYTSTEYLELVQSKGLDHIGFPEKVYGIDMGDVSKVPFEWVDKIQELDTELNTFFGSEYNAVKMYYPAGGFMGWHTNWNAPGYNILLSFNKRGDGFFRYQDPITKEIVTQDDKKGWNLKVGYYGDRSEQDKIWWHCARAYSERITLAYVIPNLDMWEGMIEDLIIPNDA